ncbi:MAG: hypothetical protein Q4G02_04085 [bacterium]|nr:hypothetical protein [bacterium]
MIIGIDIDDTICNTTEVAIAMAIRYVGEKNLKLPSKIDGSSFLIKDIFHWSDEVSDDFWLKYHDQILSLVTAKPLVQEVLLRLHRAGQQIKFITARHNNSEIYNSKTITESWLKTQNIYYDELICECQEKGEACLKQKVDVFIDDLPANCLMAAQAGIKTCVFDSVWNQNLADPRITRIYSWTHFEQFLKE